MTVSEKRSITIPAKTEVCPYLGTHWDSSIYSTVPDMRNRCYAQKKQRGVFSFIEYYGNRIEKTFQLDNCYSDYKLCPYYRSNGKTAAEKK